MSWSAQRVSGSGAAAASLPAAAGLAAAAEPALAQRRFWAYAATFGAAWGTLEITVGSFLHSLRLPFSGVLLAAVGAAILVAQRQVLPARGLTIATGLVAAACKSLSPGGVILGPMVGISTEALVVELALLLWPRAPVAAVVGGALAALWALSQTLLTQVLFYGGDMLALYVAALERVALWLGLARGVGVRALAAILLAFVAVGAAGGALGWRAGRACRLRLDAARDP
ncbi:MAG: hypothetical protein MUC69_00585 [Gemmatimonadales bacterium]|jgi:hypothetical protein|nr:hypothetical protein [Gemmatimonadales bacterium]